ncbi:MAG: STAS domain-containing protein [Pseudomonadota bacterium]
MFEIAALDDGRIEIRGRLDAAKAPRAQEFLDRITGACVIDMSGLEYISSAGLGVLLRTHKRLLTDGEGVRLVNVNSHILDIFTYSGFDRLFHIEADAGQG